MNELTRDEILDAHANCNGKCSRFYKPCPLNAIDCEIAVREAIKSLRDDHNAEVKKNKRLESELAKVAAERDAATPENTVVVPRIGDTLYYTTVWNTHQFEEKNQGKINAIKIFENIILVCIDDSCLEFDLKKQHKTWFLDRDEWEKAGEIIYNMKKCLSELSCQYCGQSNTMRIVCDSVQCSYCGKNIN